MKQIALIALIIFSSCSDVPPQSNNTVSSVTTLASANCEIDNGWTVPIRDIVDGGVGQGGIPAIDKPHFIDIDQVDFLRNDELVIMVKVGPAIKIYPHRIMDFHEIVNDDIHGVKIALTFCPLSGTAAAWEREALGVVSVYSVSGLLYNANLITTDDQSNTKWSQVLGHGINGDLACEELSGISVLEIKWSTAQMLYPTAKVLSTITGFDFDYSQTPLSYNQPLDALPLFPVNSEDDRLGSYERVHVVSIGGKNRAYRFSEFDSGPKIIIDRLGNQDIMIIGSKSDDFIVSYLINGSEDYHLDFVEGRSYSVIAGEDKYNLFGEIYEGPRAGGTLKSPGMTGYWFSLSAFYPQVEIYSSSQLGG